MRWNAWMALVTTTLVGQLLWIFLLRGPRILDSDLTLILGELLLGMCVIGIAQLIATTPVNAIKLTLPNSRMIIIGGSVLLHFWAILLLWPALSSDVTRYRLDGLTWLTGRSPYAVTPRQMLKTPNVDAIDRTLPGNDSYSIFPPVAQTVFIAARAIEMAVVGPAKLSYDRPEVAVRRWRPALPYLSFRHRAIVLRAIFSIAAVGCTCVLLSLLKHTHRTPWLAVLFAWNPLVILETAGSPHVDIVGVLLLLVMLRMIQKSNFSLATLALCLACGVKPMAILLAPLLIQKIDDRHDWKVAQRSIGVALLTLGAVFVPILLVQHGYRGWIVQLNAYAHLRETNSLLFAVAKSVVGASWITGNARPFFLLLAPLAAASVLLWMIKKRWPIEDAGYWLMLVVLVFSPASQPWSLVWPLCFVPVMRLSRGWSALAWTATITISYAAWHQASWNVPARIVIAEYVPVLVAMGIEISDLRQRYAALAAATASASV
ncbi:DUF2029 domain-containing protein [soil metagenome]